MNARLCGSTPCHSRSISAAPVPSELRLKKINSEIRSNESQLAQSLRNLSRKDDIKSEYQKYIQYIKSNYSEGEETAKLLEEIEDLGRNAGISITDIKPQPPKEVNIYKYYSIEVEAEGHMEALMTFFHQLSSSKQLFRVGKAYINVKDREVSIAKASILVTKVVVQ